MKIIISSKLNRNWRFFHNLATIFIAPRDTSAVGSTSCSRSPITVSRFGAPERLNTPFTTGQCLSAYSTRLHSRNGRYSTVRYYSSESPREQDTQRPSRRLPLLSDFPQLVWPSVIKSIRNWIMVHFIVRPYFDREFNLPDFVQGAKQALQVVSSSLAGGEIKHLDGLVTQPALNDLKKAIATMSVAQRYDLKIEKDDIYFSFPYQVGVIFDESTEDSQQRYVEITMVFHVLKGLKGMQERGESVPLNIGVEPEFRDKISICNYRFIKEFTKGVDSDWTINVVSHFKPSDYINE